MVVVVVFGVKVPPSPAGVVVVVVLGTKTPPSPAGAVVVVVFGFAVVVVVGAVVVVVVLGSAVVVVGAVVVVVVFGSFGAVWPDAMPAPATKAPAPRARDSAAARVLRSMWCPPVGLARTRRARESLARAALMRNRDHG